MTHILSNGLKLMTLFITGSMLLGSLTGCGVYKELKQKEETRLMQSTREATIRELAERKAEKEANKNWLQRHWTGVSITSIGVLATAVVSMAAFMFFKWPQDGKQGKQGLQGIQGDPGMQGFRGPQGLRGERGFQGEPGEGGVNAKTLEQIQQNTTDIQQVSAAATRVEDAVRQQSDIIEKQGQDIAEVKALTRTTGQVAEAAASMARSAFTSVGSTAQRLDAQNLRIVALENPA